MSSLSNRDRFNEYAGYALAKLDEAHPHRIVLVPSRMVRELGQEQGKRTTLLCQASVEWLARNNYLHCVLRAGDNTEIAETVFAEATLTDKAWAKLGVEVDFRGRTERLGDALKDEVKKVGEGARSSAIGEIVGQVIGGITKSILGG